MAYFSNGSEGEYYMERCCYKCVHETGCPVLHLHMMWNYDQQSKTPEGEAKKQALNILWPREGVHNGDCKMFKEKGQRA